jgi:hypothetical protein
MGRQYQVREPMGMGELEAQPIAWGHLAPASKWRSPAGHARKSTCTLRSGARWHTPARCSRLAGSHSVLTLTAHWYTMCEKIGSRLPLTNLREESASWRENVTTVRKL